MKRIVFDIDNTLIMWQNHYWESIDRTFKEFGLDYNDIVILRFKEAIENYEKEFNIYKKEYMRDIIEKYTGIALPNNFVDRWCDNLKDAAPIRIIEVEKTLSYLYQKYELYALTNWFTEQQSERLKRSNLLKYFKRVIGTDQILIKPNKESFLEAIRPRKSEECIMIGDSLNVDIRGAINVGMKAILIDKSEVYETNEKFIVIRNIKELESIL